jgi:hypothetical protein
MKKNHAPDKSLNQTKNADFKTSNTNITIQRKRLLEALILAGSNGITTIEARHRLNILAPAPRVHELRHNDDLNIQTVWREDYTPEGYPHNVASYVLTNGSFKEAQANV